MQGRLIYLIGPSGAGKDSLLDAARAPLAERGVRIARRVITRSAEAIGEAAHSVSIEQFERLEAERAFALAWRANGLAYGIPAEIDAWLAAGEDVLVNGSRGYLPEARQRYPDLLAVLLTVEQDVLRERLLIRGRETPEQIEGWRAMHCSAVSWTTTSAWTIPLRCRAASNACCSCSTSTANAADPARHRRRRTGAGV